MKAILNNLRDYLACFNAIRLRPYQVEAAQAVLESVLNDEGETFVWIFARQGGKDETLAALYQYLMVLFSFKDISIVSAAPTFRPQAQQAMQRLDARLSHHLVLKKSWKRWSNTFHIGAAQTIFFSGQSRASVLGATAWPLLVINEAQDIDPAVYDRRFAPMAAADNATRLFSGTAWTRSTLLAREERLCRLKEEQDGRKRVFLVDGPQIASVHPPYGKFLEGEITRLGRDHPIVVSQYLCREIDAQAGMFTPTRLALMLPSFSPLHQSTDGEGSGVGSGLPSPVPGLPHAFLLDVAGQDETRLSAASLDSLTNPGRDSTTLSIVQIDLSSLETLQAPTYRVVMRFSWTGESHLAVFGKLKALAETWRPQHIVIDATGVGEGLWSLLDKAFPNRVSPVKFTQQVKSDLGWGFLAIIETGRFRDCYTSPPPSICTQMGGGWEGGLVGVGLGSMVNPDTVLLQYASCQCEILPGPAKTLRWGVPEGLRGPDGSLIHDDFILADSLTVILDKMKWVSHSPALMIHPRDPLLEMDTNF